MVELTCSDCLSFAICAFRSCIKKKIKNQIEKRDCPLLQSWIICWSLGTHLLAVPVTLIISACCYLFFFVEGICGRLQNLLTVQVGDYMHAEEARGRNSTKNDVVFMHRPTFSSHDCFASFTACSDDRWSESIALWLRCQSRVRKYMGKIVGKWGLTSKRCLLPGIYMTTHNLHPSPASLTSVIVFIVSRVSTSTFCCRISRCFSSWAILSNLCSTCTHQSWMCSTGAGLRVSAFTAGYLALNKPKHDHETA